MTTVSPTSGSPASVHTDLQGTMSDHLPSATANNNNNRQTAKPATKSKPRKRVNTAEKRNQHNAIERARRETLNGKFIHLARLLPSLASHRRPSKSAIVNGSIAHLGHQREQRLLAARLLRQITAERDELAAEVNRWRVAGGIAGAVASTSWSEEMEQVCAVEKEVFGTFANVDGEGEGDDAEDDDDMANDVQEQNFPGHLKLNGLITPRSSADMDASNTHPALFGTMQNVEKSTASINGLSWSQDFAFGLNGLTTPAISAPGVDQSSSGSPATSIQGVYTPPPIGDVLFGQSMQGSSPHSVPSTSAGLMNDKPAPVAAQQQPIQQWAQQQVLLMQLQRAQQAAASHSQQAQAAVPFAAFTPAGINGMFNQLPQPQQPLFSSSANPNAFTQSMLETLFPQQQQQQATTSTAEIEKWRYLALGSVSGRALASATPTAEDFETAVRRGMAMGINMGQNYWSDKPVEGFVI